MGACASFPKDLLEKKSREAPPPEEPKEGVVVTEGEKEIKVDDKVKEEDEKTLGSLLKEEKSTEETKAVVTEEKTVKSEEAVKDTVCVVKSEVESYVAPVAHATSEDKKETPKVKVEKK